MTTLGTSHRGSHRVQASPSPARCHAAFRTVFESMSYFVWYTNWTRFLQEVRSTKYVSCKFGRMFPIRLFQNGKKSTSRDPACNEQRVCLVRSVAVSRRKEFQHLLQIRRGKTQHYLHSPIKNAWTPTHGKLKQLRSLSHQLSPKTVRVKRGTICRIKW
jgi:hypothetical protein